MGTHLKYRSIIGAVAFGIALGTIPNSGSAQDAEAYIGSLFPTLGYWCPRNSVQANGQILAISGNEALYSIIGTTYGGDGRTTFGLPDMRGRTQVGAGQGPGLASRPLGQKAGLEQFSMTVAEMPAHTHTGETTTLVDVSVAASTNQATHGTPQNGDMLAAKQQGFTVYKPYAPATTTTILSQLSGLNIPKGAYAGNVVVEDAGGYPEPDGTKAYPIGLRPGTLTVRYCFVVKGNYPPRPS